MTDTDLKTIDLHVHSTASDGTLTPTELAALAAENGISAIALTDHDSISGVEEALAAGKTYGVEIVPGVELSTEHQGTEIHVVGLYIDFHNPDLLGQLRDFRDNRDNRNLKMIDRLRGAGFSITAEAVYERNPDAVIARPHIARYLADTGQVRDIKTVFDKYIGDGCPCYVDRLKISPVEAVRLIHAAGGVAVLAHPCLYRMRRPDLLALIREMKEAGLDGIEALYSCNRGSDEKNFRQIAEQYGLLLSGGSDFHGSNKPHIHLGTGRGNLRVPYELLQGIRQYHQKNSLL